MCPHGVPRVRIPPSPPFIFYWISLGRFGFGGFLPRGGVLVGCVWAPSVDRRMRSIADSVGAKGLGVCVGTSGSSGVVSGKLLSRSCLLCMAGFFGLSDPSRVLNSLTKITNATRIKMIPNIRLY